MECALAWLQSNPEEGRRESEAEAGRVRRNSTESTFEVEHRSLGMGT